MIHLFSFPDEVIFPCRCHSCSHVHSVSSHQMAGELEGEKEARELVLGALHHSMQFTLLLSQGLNPSDVTFDLRGPMTDSTHSATDPMKESTDSIRDSEGSYNWQWTYNTVLLYHTQYSPNYNKTCL